MTRLNYNNLLDRLSDASTFGAEGAEGLMSEAGEAIYDLLNRLEQAGITRLEHDLKQAREDATMWQKHAEVHLHRAAFWCNKATRPTDQPATPMRYDLAAPADETLPYFVREVSALAVADYHRRKPRQRRRSGFEICQVLCTDWRRFHRLLASTVYNKTWQSLVSAGKERQKTMEETR